MLGNGKIKYNYFTNPRRHTYIQNFITWKSWSLNCLTFVLDKYFLGNWMRWAHVSYLHCVIRNCAISIKKVKEFNLSTCVLAFWIILLWAATTSLRLSVCCWPLPMKNRDAVVLLFHKILSTLHSNNKIYTVFQSTFLSPGLPFTSICWSEKSRFHAFLSFKKHFWFIHLVEGNRKWLWQQIVLNRKIFKRKMKIDKTTYKLKQNCFLKHFSQVHTICRLHY